MSVLFEQKWEENVVPFGKPFPKSASFGVMWLALPTLFFIPALSYLSSYTNRRFLAPSLASAEVFDTESMKMFKKQYTYEIKKKKSYYTAQISQPSQEIKMGRFSVLDIENITRKSRQDLDSVDFQI